MEVFIESVDRQARVGESYHLLNGYASTREESTSDDVNRRIKDRMCGSGWRPSDKSLMYCRGERPTHKQVEMESYQIGPTVLDESTIGEVGSHSNGQ